MTQRIGLTETGRFPSKPAMSTYKELLPPPLTFKERLHADSCRLSEERAKAQSKSWAGMVKRCKMEGMWNIAEVAARHFCMEV